MIAGPNGSGKSTLIARMIALGAHLGEHFNADVIARSLGRPSRVNSLRAQELVRERRQRARDRQIDYSWETVMSHCSHIEHLLEARAVGYEVRIILIATEDPRINVARVAHRVTQGGHDVPVDRIRDRYCKSVALFPTALHAAHRARLFDNSSAIDPFQLIAGLERDIFSTPMPVEALPFWVRPIASAMERPTVA